MERAKQLNNERVAKHRAKKKELNEKIKQNEGNDDDLEMIEDNKENNNLPIDNKKIEKINVSSFNDEIKLNDECNVTGNKNNSNCNVTVMKQNKKENKSKNEKKKESKSDIKTSSDETNILTELSSKQNLNENSNNEDAANLLKHYESITGILGGLNIGLLKMAVEIHGYKNVKMAINKALEVNKANMTYINGILKNWKREGYPNDDMEVRKNGVRSIGKNNSSSKNEFTAIKPKEPRKLTDDERKRSEENII